MIKLLMLLGLITVSLTNSSESSPQSVLLSYGFPNYSLTEGEEIAAAEFTSNHFPNNHKSRSMRVQYSSIGCFHYNSEMLVMDKVNGSVVVSLLEAIGNSSEKKHKATYIVPSAIYQYALTKFNNACASILREQQKKKAEQNDVLYQSTTVTLIEVNDNMNSIKLSLDKQNPFDGLKQILLNKNFLSHKNAANKIIF
jgi:hypothetical protein